MHLNAVNKPTEISRHAQLICVDMLPDLGFLGARAGGHGRGQVRGQVRGQAGELVIGRIGRACQMVHRAGEGSALRPDGMSEGRCKGKTEGRSEGRSACNCS